MLAVAVTLSDRVARALASLGAPLTTDASLRTAGWRLAVAVAPRSRAEWCDRYTQAAARALALALDAGDLDAAERAAQWIVEPDAAMDAALAARQPTPAPAVPVHHRTDDYRRCRARTIIRSDTRLCAGCTPAPAVRPALELVTAAYPPRSPRPLSLASLGIEHVRRSR